METSKQTPIENVLDMFAPLVDFTLIAGLDEEKVPVVRKLLTQKSVYFEKLLGPSFREGSQQEVTLQDIDGPTLKAIINFIYWGSIDLTEGIVANILDGASRMELVSLEKMCEDFLRKNLSHENCFQTFVLADKHCFLALRASALECTATNVENIPTTDLLQLDGSVLGELLKCDKVYMAETSLFNLLVEWVEQNEIVHSPFMPNLLKLIRLEHFPGEFIINVAEPIFNRYELNELISTEYRRRIRNHQISPRRCHEKGMWQSIFYAEIVKDCSIEIIDGNNRAPKIIGICRLYPDCKKITSFTVSTSRIDQGWIFHGGRIYQIGGYYSDEGGHTSAEVECIDMDTKLHTKLPNMINARSAFSIVASGQYIYVFGGRNKHRQMDDCERFDTQKSQWEALPKLPFVGRNYGFGMNGKVFLVSNPLFHAPSWCEYDPGTNHWSKVKEFSGWQNKRTDNHDDHVLCVILDKEKIYLIDTRKSPSVYLGTRNILLPGITICKIMECAGSPYIFYTSYNNKHKFGRIVFDGDECKVVDSVETGQNFSEGFLFMR